MPLIVIKRKEKGMANGCLECPHFVELKDDKEQYPSTVAVVCNAPQTEWVKCFEYMWLMVRGRISRGVRKKPEVRVPLEPDKAKQMQEVLKRLRAIRKH